MKNRIICLVLSLAIVVGLFSANSAYAWFVSSVGGSGGLGPTGNHLISAGNVGFTIVGDFKTLATGAKIVPEDELLVDLSAENAATINSEGCRMYLANSSTINTQLRIKIEYSYNGATAVYDKSDESPLTVELTDGTLWGYNGGYLYYGEYSSANSGSSDVLTAPEVGTPQNIPLFDSIRYSGPNTENSAISGMTVTVKVIFEARQSDYVGWTTVGTIYVAA